MLTEAQVQCCSFTLAERVSVDSLAKIKVARFPGSPPVL